MTEHHQHIALNKLTAWEDNVRKTVGADTALAELAASIAAHGLLQSLVVRKDKRGKFAVVGGRRRLSALTLLAENGRIDADMEIPCRILSEEVIHLLLRNYWYEHHDFQASRKCQRTGGSTGPACSRIVRFSGRAATNYYIVETQGRHMLWLQLSSARHCIFHI